MVHFRLPARFNALDKVIHKLETFTEPTFYNLQHTRKVVVVGSWYSEYTELETEAGLENVLSPAVRMFSTLVDVCLARMGNLQNFVYVRPSCPLPSVSLTDTDRNLAGGMPKYHQRNDWFHDWRIMNP